MAEFCLEGRDKLGTAVQDYEPGEPCRRYTLKIKASARVAANRSGIGIK